MPDATFGCPDLTRFCRLDELGLVVVGQRLEPDRAVLAEGRRVLINDPGRLNGVKVIGSMSTCGATPAAGTSTSP